MDYEEKYKEALERARQFFEKPYLEDSAGIVGYIFPELKESEDERIRNGIIQYLEQSQFGEEHYQIDDDIVRNYIAWLEKQGEQKPDIIIPKFRVGDTIRIKNSDAEYTITDISDGCYRGKGWCLDIAAGDKCGDYELVENKHAGWSKEDERNFDVIYGIIYNSCNAEDASRLIEWLKSLKDRVQSQPSQEWSEDDRITRNALIKLVEKLYESSIYELDKNRLLDWLKSLRPQSTWKPSEKQLVALRIAIGDEQGSDCCDILRSLLKDLSNRFKAQKGE